MSLSAAWVYALLSVIAVSSVSLIGIATISINPRTLRKITSLFVSFAVGGLFGDAFIHLIPESFKSLGFGVMTSLSIFFGVLLFFVLEKFIRWRHCHLSESKIHHHPVVVMNLVGDFVHNLIDGIAIGASYLVSIELGLTTTIAIVLHEIPQEIGEFGVLVHHGLSAKSALMLNFASGFSAVLGALFSLTLGSSEPLLSKILLPMTAGGFIYIAGSDLIPGLHDEVNPKKSVTQLFCVSLGVLVMVLLTLLD